MHNPKLISFHYSVTVGIFHVKLGLRTSVWMKLGWKMLLTIVMTKSLNFSSCWLSFQSYHLTCKNVHQECVFYLQFSWRGIFYVCSNFKRACTLQKPVILENRQDDKSYVNKCYCFSMTKRNYVDENHATFYTDMLVIYECVTLVNWKVAQFSGFTQFLKVETCNVTFLSRFFRQNVWKCLM